MSRVLIVEDEVLIAMVLEDMLLELGHEIVGSVQTISDALTAAKSSAFDVAILDLNLNGAQTFDVADILIERGIPFIIASGSGRAGLGGRYPDADVVTKPYTSADLGKLLTRQRGDASD